MSAETIAYDLAAQQGWTDTTLLGLCLSYIDNQQSNNAFADYLRGVADAENSPGACGLCGGPMSDTDGDGVFFCAVDCQEPDDEDDDEEEEFGPYDWTCSHCGSSLNEDNFDRTGSRRCDDLDPEHKYHLDLGDNDEEDEDDQPDVDADHDIRAEVGSGDPGYDEAVAQESEARRLDLIARVEGIAARKRAGVSPTAEESEAIKTYLRPRQEMSDDPTSHVAGLAALFPDEWDSLAAE